MSALTVIFGAVPGLFQQDKNIADNKVLYQKYSALVNEILSYTVTGEAIQDPSVAGPKQLLQKSKTVENSKPTNGNSNSAPENPPQKPPQTGDTEENKSRTGIAVTPAEFIHYVDQQLALGNIAIGFD